MEVQRASSLDGALVNVIKRIQTKNHENRVTDLVVFPSDPLSAYRAMFLHIPAFQLNDPKL